MLILTVILFVSAVDVKTFLPFELSVSCIKDSSTCNKEELEYLSISELHDQIDDDKDGNIDIVESKDFVEEALSFSRGSEKAKIFHKNDAQIDKQDLWHIWRTSEVSNWTMNDLLNWLSYDVELPQYVDTFTILKLNGSSIPRLTGNDYLMNIVKISNSIHRKKIMIKAVDAVLFGPTRKFQLSKKWFIFWISIFTLLIVYFYIQTLYSKRFVKTMQKKLENLSETENNLSELREQIKEAEEFKQQKFNEIQEMEERHRFELSSTKNSSRDSLFADTDKLQEAHKEIAKLKATLFEYQLQIHKLTNNTMGHHCDSSDHKDGHLLQSLLQLTYATERQYLYEKIAAVDRQSMECKELNEKVKKKKAGFMGSFRLVHTNDLDELEQGFTATKKAYEALIYEKNELETRWNKLESITGLQLIHSGDPNSIKQVIRWISTAANAHEGIQSSGSILHQNEEKGDYLVQLHNNSLDGQSSMPSQSSTTSTPNLPDVVSIDSVEGLVVPLEEKFTSEYIEVHKRSRKDFSEKRKTLFGGSRTRIPSLNRSNKKY